MTFTSSLRFLYIFYQSGLLCGMVKGLGYRIKNKNSCVHILCSIKYLKQLSQKLIQLLSDVTCFTKIKTKMSFSNYFGYIAPVICFGLTLWICILASYTNIYDKLYDPRYILFQIHLIPKPGQFNELRTKFQKINMMLSFHEIFLHFEIYLSTIK